MKALVYTAPHQIGLQELPTPTLGADEVLVRVAACGICGSDLHGFHGKSAIRVPPMVMGHEFCGQVVESGPGVSDQDGKRVVVQPLVGCGHCAYCLSGRSNICPDRKLIGGHLQGAFAEYVRVPARQIYPISDAMDDMMVTLVEPLANAVHMLNLAGGALDRNVVVLGAGTLGLVTVALARHAGARAVIATDVDDTRRDAARTLGAHETVNAADDDAIDRIRDLIGGADIVIDAAGYTTSRQQAIAIALPGAAVVLLGLADPRSELPMGDIINREIAVRGSYSCTDSDFRTAIHVLEDGAIETESWVQTGSLDEGTRFFERLADREEGLFKVVLSV